MHKINPKYDVHLVKTMMSRDYECPHLLLVIRLRISIKHDTNTTIKYNILII